jgi:hypothetical protein
VTTRVVAEFKVTGWDQAPHDEQVAGPRLARATVRKAFEGELKGTSTAELLMCQADPANLAAGAGYVASERFVGRLRDRTGSFVMQHWGLSGNGGAPRTAGHVVPGSGTDGLAGLTGTVEIVVAPGGGHTLALDYAFATNA